MQDAVRIKGLCSTCSKTSFCEYPRHPDWPVWHCDEFAEETAAMMRAAAERRRLSVASAKRAEAPEAENDRSQGLCRLCDERRFCTYPKPAGGVWHCEEYK